VYLFSIDQYTYLYNYFAEILPRNLEKKPQNYIKTYYIRLPHEIRVKPW